MNETNRFTLPDYLGSAYLLFQIVTLFRLSSMVGEMRAWCLDLGGSMPILSTFVLRPVLPPLIAGIALLIFMMQWHPHLYKDLKRRRGAVVICFAVTHIFQILTLIAYFLPLLKLSATVG